MDMPDKATLEELYETNNIIELRKIFRTKDSTVRKWLDQYGIDQTKHKRKQRVQKPDRGDLYYRYIELQLSTPQLASHYETSAPTIRKWLNEYDIPKRGHKEACIIHTENTSNPMPDGDSFRDNYETMTHRELREFYGTSSKRIIEWREHYNIPERSYSEACIIAKRNAFENNKRIPKDTLVSMYQKYGSISALVENTDISKRTAERLFKDYGIEVTTASRSATEVHLYEYCKELRPDVDWISNDKSLISPFELDIYSPQLKLAIEYNGLYWHSENSGKKERSYHKMKQVKCRQQGVELLTVFEYDNLEKVKRLISHKLGAYRDKVYARNTVVSAIDVKKARQFHNKYHIHGFAPSSVHLGLFRENELVQVMSMSKTRFSKNYEWECTRSTLGDVSVVGGTSKLFKAFIREHEPKSIVTYADLRFGEGKVYQHAGFHRTHDSNQNYWYYKTTNPQKIYSRIAFQKHKLEKMVSEGKLSTFDKTKTEWQNMIDNGYDRIHDCGNAVWLWES